MERFVRRSMAEAICKAFEAVAALDRSLRPDQTMSLNVSFKVEDLRALRDQMKATNDFARTGKAS